MIVALIILLSLNVIRLKQIREFFKKIFFPFVGIFLVGTVFSILSYLVVQALLGYDINQDTKDKQLDAWTKIIGISISLTGFLSIIFTIIQGRQTSQHNTHQATVELFREFRGERFYQTRQQAWEVREKWEADPNYRRALLHANFSHKGDYVVDPKYSANNLHRDMTFLYELLEFYAVIGLYKDNQEVLSGLHYFYYGWWRSFLYEVAEEIDDRRSPHLSPKLRSSGGNYIKNVSMIEVLNRLDQLCDLDKIDTKEVLHRHSG